MKKLLSMLGCTKGRIRPGSKVKDGAPEEEEEKGEGEEKKNVEPIKEEQGTATEKGEEEKKEESHPKETQNKEEEVVTVSEIKQQTKKLPNSGLNLNAEISDTDNLIDPESELICSYEKGVLNFTKKALVDFFNLLDKYEDYKEYYNKDNLHLEIRQQGSPINSEFFLIRTLYTQKKSELGSNQDPKKIIHLMYDIEARMKWDKAIKKVEKFEGNDNNFTIRTWACSPIFLISEREGIEKRMIFQYENAHYVLSTSVPDNYIPPNEGVVRITNYINFFKCYEDKDNYYFLTLNQSDFKMPIPQQLMNITLPLKTKDWFNNFKKAAESTTLDKI